MNTVLLILIAVTVLVSLLTMNNSGLQEKYRFSVGAIRQRKEYYRLLTSAFLHADFFHLFFNMMTLYFCGPTLINMVGETFFLIVYFGSVLAGNLFTLYLYQWQAYYSAIGASGGVSGVLFAAITMLPYFGVGIMFIPVQIPGFIFGALYFGYSVYMMLNPRPGDLTGHSAHLGGAAFGLVCAIAQVPTLAVSNILEIGIMSLPLIYMAIKLFGRRH